MNFIPIELSRDYPTLLAWWAGHKSLPVHRQILPRGWIAEEGGIEIAASFLYIVIGSEANLGLIEWTTTNPDCCMSRSLLDAVKGLYAHLESVAAKEGCVAMFSLVAPNTGEERIMARMGYTTDGDPARHLFFQKAIANQS